MKNVMFLRKCIAWKNLRVVTIQLDLAITSRSENQGINIICESYIFILIVPYIIFKSHAQFNFFTLYKRLLKENLRSVTLKKVSREGSSWISCCNSKCCNSKFLLGGSDPLTPSPQHLIHFTFIFSNMYAISGF